MTTALVSCVKTKRKGTHPARDLYTSPLFRFAFDYATRHTDRVYILSAKHGLIEPAKRIKSYDQTLKKMATAERQKWAKKVAAQIRRAVPANSTLVFLCGDDYRRDLICILGEFEHRIPLEGLSFGRQLQWYKQHR